MRYGGESRITTRPSMGEDIRFNHPFSCFVSGPSVSGMSSFCFAFSQNLKTHCTEPNFSGEIIWCNSKSSIILYRQLPGKKHVRFHEGVPADFNNYGKTPCLIILDGLLNEYYSKDYVTYLRKVDITGMSVSF